MSATPAPRTRPEVSVCMASYNGEAYIAAQLRSILAQLSPTDEVVIVDDASSDGTVSVVEEIGDRRIRLLRQAENVGYVRTFERALSAATGEFLLLSDQDDLWAPGRVDALRVGLRSADVVASNLDLLESSEGTERSTGTAISGPMGIREWRLPRVGRSAPLRNSVGVLAGVMPYFGCAMGVRRDFAATVLPFPSWLHESHDLWIALNGNIAGRIAHIADVTTYRRLHDANASPSQPRSLQLVIRSRVLVLRMILAAMNRRRALARSAQPAKAT